MEKNYQNIYNEYLQKLAELDCEEEIQIDNMSILSWEVLEKAKEQITETFRLRKEELAGESPYKEAILYRQQMIDAWNAFVQAKRKLDKDQLCAEKNGVEQKLNTVEQECGSAQAEFEKEKRIFENAKAAYEASKKLYEDTKSRLDGLKKELNDVTEKERKYNEEVNHAHWRYIAAAQNYWVTILDEIWGNDIKELIIQEISTRLDNEEEFVKIYDGVVSKLIGMWFIVPSNVRELKKAILGNSDWLFDELMDAIYWKKPEIEPEDNKEEGPEGGKGSEPELTETPTISSNNSDKDSSKLEKLKDIVVKYISWLDRKQFRYSWAYHLLCSKDTEEPVKLAAQLVGLYKNPEHVLQFIINAPLTESQALKFLRQACSKVAKMSARDRNYDIQRLNGILHNWEFERKNRQVIFLGAFGMRPEDINSDDCPNTPFLSWWTCSWTWKKKRK